MAQGDVTILDDEVVGPFNVIRGTVELSSTYPSGGVALGTAKFGLVEVYHVTMEPVELAATTALIPRYDAATDKIMLHEGDGPTTAGPLAETDEDVTSSGDVKFMAWGKKSGALS